MLHEVLRSGQTRVRILGVESSCDETAAAIVDDGRSIRASIVASQFDLHRRYGGVVPEIASRAHLERIIPVIREALAGARGDLASIDAVAAGVRPGLIGSLLVGTSAAKGIAWALGVPFLGVDHVEAHLAAAGLEQDPFPRPALGLVVSGGHTSLFEMEPEGSLRRLGRTIDDAAGEAFDKAAAMLGLPHPGGPRLEELARAGDPTAVRLPRPMLGPDSLDFSFSGLKTAFRLAILDRATGADDVRSVAEGLPPSTRGDLAASFQAAVVETLLRKIERAIDQGEGRFRSLVVGGGVVANETLRQGVAALAARRKISLGIPRRDLCLDNAAMIAAAATARARRGEQDPWWLPAEPLSRWSLAEVASA